MFRGLTNSSVIYAQSNNIGAAAATSFNSLGDLNTITSVVPTTTATGSTIVIPTIDTKDEPSV